AVFTYAMVKRGRKALRTMATARERMIEYRRTRQSPSQAERLKDFWYEARARPVPWIALAAGGVLLFALLRRARRKGFERGMEASLRLESGHSTLPRLEATDFPKVA